MNFSERTYKKELLDRDDLPFEDIRQNMKELEFINTHLGGHDITISGLQKLLPLKKDITEISIAEIGCGGGDNLLAIINSMKDSRTRFRCIGIDINPSCIAVAKEKLRHVDAVFICADYKLADLMNNKPDFIFSSLFCHHFTNPELTFMLGWMRDNSKYGFFINDLQRNPVAYYSIKWLTRLFSRSYLVKNDAPLSVLRGFKRKDWELLLKQAGIREYELEWKWAFRFLLTVKQPT